MLRKILIAEDDEINRMLLVNMLSSDYEVIETSNGKQALESLLINHSSLSAVLLDLSMPIVDGFEVLRAIRDSAELSQLPVIVATASSEEEAKSKAIALGANDFIEKPYNADLLLNSLRNTIRLRESASIINAIQRDKLTGLYNREYFFERMAEMIKQQPAGYYVLSSFDIDNFKLINDQYGAQEGDRILREIANLAGEDVSKSGGIISRINADNFAALYPAKHLGSSFLDRLQDMRFSSDNTRISTVFSVGRYIIEDLSLSANAIYDRAYIAKKTVKGRYDTHIAYFDDKMLERLFDEQKIISDMGEALENRQFEVWFQPQLNLVTGAIIGAEALVRWRHPARGMIMPGTFIPVFEQNGFIYELDRFVWEESCRLLQRWISEGRRPLAISVNISRYDIYRADLIETIDGLVKKYNVPIELLRLEITESAFSVSSDQIIQVVHQLTERGYTIEIDDFGSDYSSLNTLKAVPASVLKLDMRFIDNNGDNDRGGNIIASVVRMAKWLDMSVVAEGVETREQADFLKSIGCDYAQGYLYAKPMPIEDYESFALTAGKEQQLITMESVVNLNNNRFWDPESMDTLIFNSYVGGACIFEHWNGGMEMLRVNDKYVSMMVNEGLSVDNAMKLRWGDCLDEDILLSVRESIISSAETGEEFTVELPFSGLPGCNGTIYLRATMRVIAKTGDRRLVYCTNENITAQRLAEHKEKQLANQLQAIMGNVNSGIIAIVADKTNTASIVFSNDKYYRIHGYTRRQFHKEIDSIFEVVHPDNRAHVIERVNSVLQSGKSATIDFRSVKRDGKIIYIRSNISSVDITGIGAVLLAVLTDITELRAAEQRERSASEQLQAIMNDTPGGFVRMKLQQDGRVVPVFVNKGFLGLVNMSYEQYMSIYSESVFAGIHPDDAAAVKSVVAQMYILHASYSVRCRLITGDDSYIWVVIYGKTIMENGELYINSYYVDANEQIRLERQQNDLLDNMPVGAALYEYDGKNIKTLHFNTRFMQMVNRSRQQLEREGIIASVHPDDLRAFMQKLPEAINSAVEFECQARIRDGEGEYRYYLIFAKAVPTSDNKANVYVVFSEISDEKRTYQEMLPIALATVMSASPDMTFVKDRTLRYICCSRSYALSLGFSDEQELIGKTDEQLIGKKAADKYRKIDLEILKTGKPQLNIDEKAQLESSGWYYTNYSKYPLLDSNGNVIGVYCVMRDVTEFHTAYERLLLLTESIPGGIASYNITPKTMELCYCNEGYYRFTGLDLASFFDKSKSDPLFWVLDEYKTTVASLVEDIRRHRSDSLSTVYRCRSKDGIRWFSINGTVSDTNKSSRLLNIVQLDITEQKNIEEQLRISREQFKIAASFGNRSIARYNIGRDTLYHDSELIFSCGYSSVITKASEEFARCPVVDRRSVNEVKLLNAKLAAGEKAATSEVLLNLENGVRWYRIEATTIFKDENQPDEALFVFYDVTEQRQKESVYTKWLQSMRDKPKDSYTLFRCNLNKDTSYDSVEGNLLQIRFSEKATTFDSHTREYAEKYVHAEDRKQYISSIESNSLLAGYYRGQRHSVMEYREMLSTDEYRWLRRTIELVEFPNSTEIEAYLLYEDIDKAKRQELKTIALAHTDALTGVLNRNAFAERMNRFIGHDGRACALIMLDIDGFKLVNDSLGHKVGDSVLVDVTEKLGSIIRQDDLIGRLGGDEFLICLTDISSRAAVAKKARQICAIVRKSLCVEITVSVSLGISLCPDDGADFDGLYHKADVAMYHVKALGKDNFAFYNEDMRDEIPDAESIAQSLINQQNNQKRRMLIVEDDITNRQLLTEIFKDEFLIDTAEDGTAAFVKLQRYGGAISIVLLDLEMPGMNGFEVLEHIKQSPQTEDIPVIVVSGNNELETGVRSIRCGAFDFVTKPVDPELLRVRVSSAISRAENERLYASNEQLVRQSIEVARYRAVLENDGVVIIEYDRLDGSFVYDKSAELYIAGRFDSRPLWQLLREDNVASANEIAKLERLLNRVAGDEGCMNGSDNVTLKTPSGSTKQFICKVIRRTDEYQSGNKLILTLSTTE